MDIGLYHRRNSQRIARRIRKEIINAKFKRKFQNENTSPNRVQSTQFKGTAYARVLTSTATSREDTVRAKQNNARTPLAPLTNGKQSCVSQQRPSRANFQGISSNKRLRLDDSRPLSPSSSLAPNDRSPASTIIDPSTGLIKKKQISLSTSLLEEVTRRGVDFVEDLNAEANFTPESTSNASSSTNYHDFDVHLLYQSAELVETLDLGDPTFTCSFCNAKVWYEERAEKSKNSNNPQFSLCCMKGKVQLPFLKKPPKLMRDLMSNVDPRSSHYKENIRIYNSMFAFTSLGAKVDRSLNDGSGPPQFILRGQNYHRIGSLLPSDGKTPKFAQLYIYDTEHEIENRLSCFRSMNSNSELDSSLVEDLKNMIDSKNEVAKAYRRVRDEVNSRINSEFCLRLFRTRCKDPRLYNLPSSKEIAALIVGDFDASDVGRDIIVRKQTGELERIPETHPLYLPMQYPMLFPKGEDGYNENIPIRETESYRSKKTDARVSLREFIAFRIQERENEFGTVVNSGKLYQQFLVDCFSMIESQRLLYIRLNQSSIRSEYLSGIQEAINKGETDPSYMGKRIVLPASFTGGTRYMFQNCQDAMSICKKMGYPDLFITFTCNSNWDEFKRYLSERDLNQEDKPDMCSRIFKMKLDDMVADFKEGKTFGKIDAGMYTIEFQKRGLPHAHILLWLAGENKINSSYQIDQLISAEFPDPVLYPRLHQIVTNFMVHGPCGKANLNCPCMKKGHCTKFYPKSFQTRTTIDENGYPSYRRRNSSVVIKKKGVELDNRNVVPYNPYLLVRYNAHINVEYCNKSNAIKYLFKYVTKGPDRGSLELSNSSNTDSQNRIVDEIKQFYDCRYLSASEAVWRTFSFDVHDRWPPVYRLSFHEEGKQPCYFKEYEKPESIVFRNKVKCTMFLAWMEANKQYPEANQYTYPEFPSYFVFDRNAGEWHPRKQGNSIGRLYYVPPGSGELFYLRLLLTVQRGCRDFKSIRTVKGVTYATFRDACSALGMLKDDKEFIDGITEAYHLASGAQLRRLFVTLLISNSMSRPKVVWEKTWYMLADGILYDRRRISRNPGLELQQSELMNLCLIELEKILHSNGRSLKEFGSMPFPENSDLEFGENRFLLDELNYNVAEMKEINSKLVSSFTSEQRNVYDEILNSVSKDIGGFFFVYGYGGTGKTFIWNAISSALRGERKIVLTVASSGIASLLLPGGRTAHSRFSIPLELKSTSTCNIKHGSFKADLLTKTSLIIWDEAPMLNRWCFEALDRTLKDLMKKINPNNENLPFGGKVVVLGGDFRQILPVIPGGSREDIVSASINSSKLWKHCKVLKLTKNMRLQTAPNASSAHEIEDFASLMLQIGDGDLGVLEDEFRIVEIPNELLITESENPLLDLVNFTYPSFIENMKNYKFFEERAILTPILENVEHVNEFMLSFVPGEEKEYLSSDSTCPSDEDEYNQSSWVTTEFLNDIKLSGIPNHRLILKVGVPVMLLRNIDQADGLCNGTRLIVDQMMTNIIAATVVTGKSIGKKVLIARMDLIPTDTGLPFKFQRRQFPIVLCYAMTINKSQGQSLATVGIYLPKPVFTHGQLYVAISRVRTKNGLKFLIMDEDGKITNRTTNVVYKEVFDNV